MLRVWAELFSNLNVPAAAFDEYSDAFQPLGKDNSDRPCPGRDVKPHHSESDFG